MKKPRPEHIFNRKWQLLHTEVLQEDQHWKCLLEYQLPHQIWTFYTKGLDFIYKRNKTMNGFLSVERSHVPFQYDSQKDILTVDHSHYEPDGFLTQYMEGVYRIEMIDEGNLYLYWETLADRDELV